MSTLFQAQIKQQGYEKLKCNNKYACWGDEDEKFDLGIEKWSVNTDDLKKHHSVPRHQFRYYIEKWENIKDDGAVMRAKSI